MKKRTFLKMSSAALAGAALSHMNSCKRVDTSVAPPGSQAAARLKNWSSDVCSSDLNVVYPESVEQAQAFVMKADKIRALGSQHCFNKIADSPHQLLSTKNLNKVVALDPAKKTVTVEAGIRYGTLGEYLQGRGYALHNLASLPHISVAGSVATATHGSGVKNGNLATAVSGIEFVTAGGEVVRLSKEKDGDQFLGAVVGLGGLGVVTKVTLDVRPSYQVRQIVYENLHFGELEKNFEAIMSSGYSVSLFTNWQKNNVSEVWVKSLIVEGRSEEHTSELQSLRHLVCRLLLEND